MHVPHTSLFVLKCMVAVEAGSISESQAAGLCGIDIVDLRQLRVRFLEEVDHAWADYLVGHPPQLSTEGLVEEAAQLSRDDHESDRGGEA